MNAEEIIVSMAIKYRGDWNDIYSGLSDPQNRDLEEYFKIAQKMKCKYVTILSKDYPEYLKNSFKPPFVLFYYGDISLISNIGKNVAVVGSRVCSDYAVGQAGFRVTCGYFSLTVTTTHGNGLHGVTRSQLPIAEQP